MESSSEYSCPLLVSRGRNAATISPTYDANNVIIGASDIARDVSVDKERWGRTKRI